MYLKYARHSSLLLLPSLYSPLRTLACMSVCVCVWLTLLISTFTHLFMSSFLSNIDHVLYQFVLCIHNEYVKCPIACHSQTNTHPFPNKPPIWARGLRHCLLTLFNVIYLHNIISRVFTLRLLFSTKGLFRNWFLKLSQLI